ncbi:proline-rich transmembrane protein 4 isoform X2 [Peromyscus eremicus]|uniref:proline-rich transmembrane protein 4 isoform X2 n=1 Tax=Peromyscus eremicus TaxID=42410 RepID=UPI0027DC385E|nr:proline-rich transmembrane protein 4 isoform X2 [Peromyscus eremicus]
MAGLGCLELGLFCWVLLAVPVGPQPASSAPGAPLTTLTPAPQSEASMLSLNLGLNFKFHLRGPAAVWGSPVTETHPLSPGLGQESEEEVEGDLRTDPLWELLVGSPGNYLSEWGSAEGSSTPRASSLPPESTPPVSGPTKQPTAPSQPRMGTVTWATALTATAPTTSAPRPHQSELELKFGVALRAGAAPTLGHRSLPLLPSLRASLAEIAGRLGPFGFFGTTLSPLRNFSGQSSSGTTAHPSSASEVSDSPGLFGTTRSLPPPLLEREFSSSGLSDLAASPSSASIKTTLAQHAAIARWTSARLHPSTCGAASRRPSVARRCWLLASFRALHLGKPFLGSASTAPSHWGTRQGQDPVRGRRRSLDLQRLLSSLLLGPGPQAAAPHLALCADSHATARPCFCVPAPTGPRAVRLSASSVPRGPQGAAPTSQPQDPTRPYPHPPATPLNILLSCRLRRHCCKSNSWMPADRLTS